MCAGPLVVGSLFQRQTSNICPNFSLIKCHPGKLNHNPKTISHPGVAEQSTVATTTNPLTTTADSSSADSNLVVGLLVGIITALIIVSGKWDHSHMTSGKKLDGGSDC